AEAVRDERLPSSQREPTGLSHGARTPLQPDPISAARSTCRAMKCGSGRRQSPHTRLVSQPADPHLRRLSLSGDTLHHVIRWNVECATSLLALLKPFFEDGIFMYTKMKSRTAHGIVLLFHSCLCLLLKTL